MEGWVFGGQNKTGFLSLASEVTCEPRASKRELLQVGVLCAGRSESSLQWLLTLLIECDIM